MPDRAIPSSGTAFHSLHATSQALHPMQIEVSVKKPIRGGCSGYPARAAGSTLISHLRPGVAGDARPPVIVPDQLAQRGSARAAAGPDVTSERLDLLDVHVRVQGQVSQVVR